MENNNNFYVPAKAQQIFTTITPEQLAQILPKSQLSNKGIITSLVVRPEPNTRKIVDTMHILDDGIEADKKDSLISYTPVTLMRSDVSSALGGAQIPGDNIHVAGLDIGQKSLNSGDLIVVTENDSILENSNITPKAILLKTDIPHHACWKIESRCGKTALSFLNAESVYENGHKTINGDIIHGLQDRLRGLKLFVLKAGIIKTGDVVTIVKDEEKVALLNSIPELKKQYGECLENTRLIAGKIEQQELVKRNLRKK
ncbi:hypothetical protein Noda2021_12210 [Candidatus Dependentiae bacterium Noda2021]|nr:hypothetical protein Noda2021_12210 [Candidatus Dependentiae bacterium Noda2021]